MIGLVKGTARQAKTVSGLPLPIASYKSNSKSPIQALSLSINPTQSGSGDPYPAGGGKNKMPNAIPKTETINGITFMLDDVGVFSVKGTATAEASCDFPIGFSFTILSGTPSPKFVMLNSQSNSTLFKFFNDNTQVDSWGCAPANRATTYSGMQGKTCNSYRITVPAGATVDMTISPMLVENSVTDYSYAPYSNIRPITGVSSDTISVADGDNVVQTTYTVQLGDTYYGAMHDVVRGKLVVDRGYATINNTGWYSFSVGTGNASAVKLIDCLPLFNSGASNYNGSIMNVGKEFPNYWTSGRPNEVCSDMAYAYYLDGNNKMNIRIHRSDVASNQDVTAFQNNLPNDIQLVYYLATPIEIDLTPTQINSLLGQNNIWHDGNGDVESLKFMDRQLYFGR